MDHSFHKGTLPNLKLKLALFTLHDFTLYRRKSLFTVLIIWGECGAEYKLDILIYRNLQYFIMKQY